MYRPVFNINVPVEVCIIIIRYNDMIQKVLVVTEKNALFDVRLHLQIILIEIV